MQEEQAQLYNRVARVREFKPDDRVMGLVPTMECTFLAKWHRPYEMAEKVEPVNYRVRQPSRRNVTKVYYVNLLKHWKEPIPMPALALVITRSFPDPPEVPIGGRLTPKQLVSRNQDVFSTLPGRAHVMAHNIITEPYERVRLQLYRVPETQRKVIREEVGEMLRGIIEKSKSAWSSPVVLVLKPNGISTN